MGSIGKANASVLSDKQAFYKALEKTSRNIFGKSNNQDNIANMVARDDREYADKVLDYFSNTNTPLIVVNEDSGNPEWTFSGYDKYGKNGRTFASFDVDTPTKERALDSLRMNGYSVSYILPKNLYQYAIDHTDMTPDQIRVLNAIGTAAIKEWKSRRKK